MSHSRLAVLVLFSGFASYAQPSPQAYGSLCGSVYLADTHQPVSSALVSIDDGQREPFAPQTTDSRGSFCFKSVPPGRYMLVPYKRGFLPIVKGKGDEPSVEVTMQAGITSDPIELGLLPTPSVRSIRDKVWESSFTPDQRRWLGFFPSEFSSDGKYFTVVIGGLLMGGPEQVWRYNLETQDLLPISPMPNTKLSTIIQAIHWVNDTLYTSVTFIPEVPVTPEQIKGIEFKLPDGQPLNITAPFSRPIHLKTEGNKTIQVPSLPAEISASNTKYAGYRTVGPYTVVEEAAGPHTGGQVNLSRAATQTSKPVFICRTGRWFSIDDPPTVIYLNYGLYANIELFNLNNLQSRTILLPSSYGPYLLAAQRTPNGLRIAYSVRGECGVTESPEGTNPLDLPHNNALRQAQRTTHLCFLDIFLNENQSAK